VLDAHPELGARLGPLLLLKVNRALVARALCVLELLAVVHVLQRLLNPADELDLEGKGRVRRDLRRAACPAVAVVGAARDERQLALAHRLHANVVRRDELTHTELELERLISAAARIEHRAIFESADVVHPYTRAVGWD